MFRVSIWLFRYFQYFGHLLGYVYAHVDTNKREVKFYLILKVYIYLITILSLYGNFSDIKMHLQFYNPNQGLKLIPMIPKFAHLFIVIFLVLLRIKEERKYKKLFETFVPLQRTYFGKLLHLTNDKTTEFYLILQILLIIIIMSDRWKLIIVEIWNGRWKQSLNLFNSTSYKILPHYVLWHHAIILSYINDILLNLNNQLKLQKLEEPFTKIYVNTCLILQQLNNLYSPVIFCALLYILMTQSMYIFGVFPILYTSSDVRNLAFIIIHFVEYANVIVYFLICKRISETISETGEIIMEYNQNLEVSYIH